MTDAPLVGFRRWRVNDDGTLRPDAYYSAAAWGDSEEAVAVCRHNLHGQVDLRGVELAHDAPAWGCTCGLHAWYALPSVPTSYEPGIVIGAVKAWGRVIEHERGFRAERMRVLAFLAGRTAWRAVAHYMVPVLDEDTLVAYAAWCGETIDDGRLAA